MPGLLAGVHRGVIGFLVGIDWAILGYFLLLNSTYLLLIVLAALEFARHLRRAPFAGHDRAFASPLTPPVSVLVPAHNEEAGIVECVRAMLGLRYPEFEVIVIDDGSVDRTFARLRDAFGLVEVPRVLAADVPTRGQVQSTWSPRSGAPLLVIRKAAAGSRSDALNVGINAAQFPLLCMIDADCVLDEDALLHTAKPFVDNPWEVVASGGVIRAVNGCRVDRGRVTDVRMPSGWLPRIQVMEYLRAFLLGRTGWSRLGSLLVISGAFGMFRRDVVVEVGGLDHETHGEDAELVVRIHRHLRAQRRRYRIVFVAEPVCWTELPASHAVLARQRTRWSRGLAEMLWKHRRMLLAPRYGRVGLVGMPYFVVFELLSPVVELGGVVAVLIGLAARAVNIEFGLLFLLVAIGYGIFLSMAALAVEEFSFHRYPRWRDLVTAMSAAALENLGYRQLHAWWRLRGLAQAVRGGTAEWGVMSRSGFDTGVEQGG